MWDTLTLTPATVKARWRGDFADVTETIPATDSTLIEGKSLLRRKLVISMSPTANAFASVTAFLDRIVEVSETDDDLRADLVHLIASAYRYVRLRDKSITGDDRLAIAAEHEMESLNEAVKAFSRTTPNMLQVETRQAHGSQATGVVTTYSL